MENISSALPYLFFIAMELFFLKPDALSSQVFLVDRRITRREGYERGKMQCVCSLTYLESAITIRDNFSVRYVSYDNNKSIIPRAGVKLK